LRRRPRAHQLVQGPPALRYWSAAWVDGSQMRGYRVKVSQRMCIYLSFGIHRTRRHPRGVSLQWRSEGMERKQCTLRLWASGRSEQSYGAEKFRIFLRVGGPDYPAPNCRRSVFYKVSTQTGANVHLCTVVPPIAQQLITRCDKPCLHVQTLPEFHQYHRRSAFVP